MSCYSRWVAGKKRKKLTKKRIEKLLKRGARNAAELDQQLRRIFSRRPADFW